MEERISIIVPVYNAERDLRECLDSIVGQTYQNLRILLIDDGSTDGSGEICDSYAAQDRRIEVIHQKNSGSEFARMRAIQALEDEGIACFCDADDFMPLDAIEKLWKTMQETKADIVMGANNRFLGRHLFGKHIYFGAKSAGQTKIYSKELLQKPEALSGFLGYIQESNIHCGSMWGKLYKNSLLKKSLSFEKPSRYFQEDVVLNMQMCFAVEKIVSIPDIVYNYRIGGVLQGFEHRMLRMLCTFMILSKNILRSMDLMISFTKPLPQN